MPKSTYTANLITVVICAALIIYPIRTSTEAFSRYLLQSDANDLTLKNNKDMSSLDSGAKCLDFDTTFDALVASSGSVYLTAPSKVAGTTIQQFGWSCVGRYDTIYGRRDTKVLTHPNVDYRRDVFLENANIPKILASHVDKDFALIRLFEQTPRDSLTVFVYREETERVMSALKHILKENCKQHRHRFPPEDFELTDDNKCILGEASITDLILEPRIEELRGGVQDILTCELYKSMENTFPQMVFVHVKQVDRLTDLLAKHHCPELVGRYFHSNPATNTDSEMFVKLHKSGELMALGDWIKAKKDKIEWTFDYKGNQCRGKTRQMEDELFSCKDEVLQVTRKTSF